MKYSGILKRVLEAQTGEGREGRPWKRQSIILEEVGGTYGRCVCVDVWNDRIDVESLQLEQKIELDVHVESREFNGKWYTNVVAVSMYNAPLPDGHVRSPLPNDNSSQVKSVAAADSSPSVQTPQEDDSDDLPF